MLTKPEKRGFYNAGREFGLRVGQRACEEFKMGDPCTVTNIFLTREFTITDPETLLECRENWASIYVDNCNDKGVLDRLISMPKISDRTNYMIAYERRAEGICAGIQIALWLDSRKKV